ncbi:hypothetical protein [Xenorhabdus hominickii]|uniref:Transcriptional regulator n=1 Tax=Xenorhabdus hominickii TaxID=351679 RepID=A0A2G0Q235_XENHO|nr:hypothetical protein [Xenorhabdus hominickii]PHM53290.1 transcriptional regulator [Xenorhabdus hominickii]
MKFEELPDAARMAVIEAYQAIVIREAGLVDDREKELQTARLENLAESLVKGFSKLTKS